MKKLIFVGILMFFITVFLNAQDNIKKEIDNYVDKSTHSLQELNSKLMDEYGTNNIKFVKLENGKYIPVRAKDLSDAKDISEAQISSDVIIIFAIIGAVLVGLLLLRSL